MGDSCFPLSTALYNRRRDVIVWLLSLGADPNADRVMYFAASYGTPECLQLMIDAGGDPSDSNTWGPPLYWAVENGVYKEEKLQVLLAQPALDLTVTYFYMLPETHARTTGKRDLADMIVQEVRRRRKGRAYDRWLVGWLTVVALCLRVAARGHGGRRS